MNRTLLHRLDAAYDRSAIEQINDDIRDAVRASDRTVTAWAELLGVSQPLVSRWLGGGTLPLKHLKKICENL
jgi:hypothetical protein